MRPPRPSAALTLRAQLLFSLGQRDGKYSYHPLSAQASAEVLKLLISAGLLLRETLRAAPEAPSALRHPRAALRCVVEGVRPQLERRLLWNKAGLAVLYAFNNQLAFALFRWAVRRGSGRGGARPALA